MSLGPSSAFGMGWSDRKKKKCHKLLESLYQPMHPFLWFSLKSKSHLFTPCTAPQNSTLRLRAHAERVSKSANDQSERRNTQRSTQNLSQCWNLHKIPLLLFRFSLCPPFNGGKESSVLQLLGGFCTTKPSLFRNDVWRYCKIDQTIVFLKRAGKWIQPKWLH